MTSDLFFAKNVIIKVKEWERREIKVRKCTKFSLDPREKTREN